MINLSMQQLESIKSYLEDWFYLPTPEEVYGVKIPIDRDYLYRIARIGTSKLIRENLTNLKSITMDILKTDSVLIPVCVLEELIKG